MLMASIKAAAVFDPQRFNAVVLALTPKSKTMLVCFEPGQAIPVHSPGVDLTLTLLEGRATLVSGDEELADAGPGALMHAESGHRRGVMAHQRTLALIVVSPPPTPEDHREVAAHLQKGTWK